MKIIVKTSRVTALHLIRHFAEVAAENDSYSHTTCVAGLSATHTTSGGNKYYVNVQGAHGIVEFHGSRTSLATGSLAIGIRPTFKWVDGFQVDSQTLKPGEVCRVNGRIGKVVSVESSLPDACPYKEDAWADDHHEIFAWLAAESAEDQLEAIFEPISAHVLANGCCAAAYI